jgi:ribonuclease D
VPPSFNESFAVDLLEALQEESRAEVTDSEPGQESRPTPAQKTLITKLNELVDAKAGDLGVSAEILCPRGELKSLAMGRRDVPALGGWRRKEIGEALLEVLGQAQ